MINMLVAAAITLHAVYATLAGGVGTPIPTTVSVWLVALAFGLPLMFRRRWPIPVLSVVLASTIVAVLVGISIAAAVLAVAVALYPVALVVRPQYSIVALGMALLGVTFSVLAGPVLGLHFRLEAIPGSFPSDLLPTLRVRRSTRRVPRAAGGCRGAVADCQRDARRGGAQHERDRDEGQCGQPPL
jgi:hypothetical protein